MQDRLGRRQRREGLCGFKTPTFRSCNTRLSWICTSCSIHSCNFRYDGNVIHVQLEMPIPPLSARSRLDSGQVPVLADTFASRHISSTAVHIQSKSQEGPSRTPIITRTNEPKVAASRSFRRPVNPGTYQLGRPNSPIYAHGHRRRFTTTTTSLKTVNYTD